MVYCTRFLEQEVGYGLPEKSVDKHSNFKCILRDDGGPSKAGIQRYDGLNTSSLRYGV